MKCPYCDRDWLWSWCQDTFRQLDGTFCLSRHGFEDKTDDQSGFNILHCQCGTQLAVMYDDGSVKDYPPEWKDVEWELPENSFEGESPHD